MNSGDIIKVTTDKSVFYRKGETGELNYKDRDGYWWASFDRSYAHKFCISEGDFEVVKSLNKKESEPEQNDEAYIWDLVIEDIRERDKLGSEKYGTRLQANNGRDALVDAYQEALDLAVYLRRAIYERSI